jgi:hypothetical protein
VDPRPDGSRVRITEHQIAGMEGLLTTVALGRAIAFLPGAARALYPRPGIRYVEVADLPPCTPALAWTGKNAQRPEVVALRWVAARHRQP